MIKTKYKLIYEGIFFIFSLIWMILTFNNINRVNDNNWIISIILFIASTILVFYIEIYYFKTYKQLIDLSFTMDFLIALATHITYLVSLIFSIINIVDNKSIHHLKMEFWDVGFSLSFFIGIGHLLEDKIKIKTSLGIKDLLKLQSKNALVWNKDKNDYIETKVSNIKIGDKLKILKGQNIPTDGVLISENSTLDCSSLLGESIPRNINQNESILSGMKNVGNTIYYKVTKEAKDSSLSNIINQLENILKNKTNIERTSEKIVKWFLPIILFISLITFIIWLSLAYNNISIPIKTFFDYQEYSNPWQIAIYHSISILVIACPCAFGIAAPLAIHSSSGLASKNKILFSSAKIYEITNKIKYIAFDKTGTLTSGNINVVNQIGIKNENKIIKSIVSNSTHPLSKAISKFLKNEFSIELDKINEIEGNGIKTNINNNEYFLGSIEYAQKHNFHFETNIDNLNNNIIVIFTKNNKVISYFELQDSLKDDALSTINKIKKLNIKPMILSGDRKSVVKDIANKLSISKYYFNLLPIDKKEIISQYKDIIFVGDGINDVLAIKAADIGISYSSGSDITNSISDITIYENDLNLVYKAIVLIKRTKKLVKLNFIWASLFNFICIPLAFLGLIPAWLGVILMTSSTIILLINTLISRHINKKMLEK